MFTCEYCEHYAPDEIEEYTGWCEQLERTTECDELPCKRFVKKWSEEERRRMKKNEAMKCQDCIYYYKHKDNSGYCECKQCDVKGNENHCESFA